MLFWNHAVISFAKPFKPHFADIHIKAIQPGFWENLEYQQGPVKPGQHFYDFKNSR